MKTLIHVDRFGLDAVGKLDLDLTPLVLRDYRGRRRAQRIRIDGPCEIIYSPTPHPKCGARVWIETKASVVVQDAFKGDAQQPPDNNYSGDIDESFHRDLLP